METTTERGPRGIVDNWKGCNPNARRLVRRARQRAERGLTELPEGSVPERGLPTQITSLAARLLSGWKLKVLNITTAELIPPGKRHGIRVRRLDAARARQAIHWARKAKAIERESKAKALEVEPAQIPMLSLKSYLKGMLGTWYSKPRRPKFE